VAGAGHAEDPCGVLPGGTSDIGGDDRGRVPVQAAPIARGSHLAIAQLAPVAGSGHGNPMFTCGCYG
jgi:hypothetical protein